jgi:hypothetical protein
MTTQALQGMLLHPACLSTRLLAVLGSQLMLVGALHEITKTECHPDVPFNLLQLTMYPHHGSYCWRRRHWKVESECASVGTALAAPATTQDAAFSLTPHRKQRHLLGRALCQQPFPQLRLLLRLYHNHIFTFTLAAQCQARCARSSSVMSADGHMRCEWCFAGMLDTILAPQAYSLRLRADPRKAST